MSRLAVILFNLGGPDRPESVRPFLFNLFYDAAIISVPQPVRWCLAHVISKCRAPVARKIYEHLGGKSPLLYLTRSQANALQENLSDMDEIKVFICMRYWHPMSKEVVRSVKDFTPDQIVLLPLYPQYSGTTSGSSLRDWKEAAKKVGLSVPTSAICCYPTDPGWIQAQAELISKALKSVTQGNEGRVLFSAHGLPKKVIAAGDPYQWQVEKTVEAVVDQIGEKGLDWATCYQSRVGPLEWIGPSTEDELARAGEDGKSVIVVPIAFVSEHSETLVELDIEYRKKAKRFGVTEYIRVPAVGTNPSFIKGLSELVRGALACNSDLSCGTGSDTRVCPQNYQRCSRPV